MIERGSIECKKKAGNETFMSKALDARELKDTCTFDSLG